MIRHYKDGILVKIILISLPHSDDASATVYQGLFN